MVEKERYQVVITKPAQRRYEQQILSYLLEHFSPERSLQIDQTIQSILASLINTPHRGSIENRLEHFDQTFRFLLHQETRNFEIKIIYFVQEDLRTVYVTDFFPTSMHPNKIRNRS